MAPKGKAAAEEAARAAAAAELAAQQAAKEKAAREAQAAERKRNHGKIIMAAAAGDALSLRQLISNGGDVNERDVSQWMSPLHKTTSAACVKLLLDAGANVEAKGIGDATPLHQAAVNGSTECAELLVAAGAEVRTIALNGETPADRAFRHGHVRLAQLLQDVKSSPGERRANWETVSARYDRFVSSGRAR